MLYNYYRQEWLIAKIGGMLEARSSGRRSCRSSTRAMATLADGPLVGALGGGQPPGDRSTRARPRPPTPKPATDDWPFLYLRTPFIAPTTTWRRSASCC